VSVKGFFVGVNEIIGAFPSTNGRIIATIAMSFVIVGKYVSSNSWQPSYEVLAFLLIMSGIDATHFAVKRRTQFGPTGVISEETEVNSEETKTTDLSEPR
jgi:hypothetical protein